MTQLLDEAYGWGGLLNNRDCSSFTQDYFAPFGKFLHRNSKAQTTNGKLLDALRLHSITLTSCPLIVSLVILKLPESTLKGVFSINSV